jgi:hypothetical protein
MMPSTDPNEAAKPASREVLVKQPDRLSIMQCELAASARIEIELALILSRRRGLEQRPIAFAPLVPGQ